MSGDDLDCFTLSILGMSREKACLALNAARAVGTLRGIHKTGLSAQEVLTLLNERLCLRGSHEVIRRSKYALFSPATGEVRIASASMLGPFLIDEGNARFWVSPECHQGFSLRRIATKSVCSWNPGDILLFCTDGLTEARNRQDVKFGVEGLREIGENRATSRPLDLFGANLHQAGHIHAGLASVGRQDRRGISLFPTVTPDSWVVKEARSRHFHLTLTAFSGDN